MQHSWGEKFYIIIRALFDLEKKYKSAITSGLEAIICSEHRLAPALPVGRTQRATCGSGSSSPFSSAREKLQETASTGLCVATMQGLSGTKYCVGWSGGRIPLLCPSAPLCASQASPALPVWLCCVQEGPWHSSRSVAGGRPAAQLWSPAPEQGCSPAAVLGVNHCGEGGLWGKRSEAQPCLRLGG